MSATSFGGAWSAPLPEDYPRPLADRFVARPGLNWRLLLLLVAAALAARTAMWLRDPPLLPDGAYYLTLSKAIAAGDLRASMRDLQLNLYPALLAGFGWLGLDPQRAAVAWGVLAAVLTVLPLFGYLRRAFDERLATVACLLYAVHPVLIEWSPQVVRDPTYWLLATTSVYVAWRTVTEVRWYWFALLGITWALAIGTRMEAILLAVPIVWWTVARCRTLKNTRWKLALGVTAALAALPVAIIVANVALGRLSSPWYTFRTAPLAAARQWTETALAGLSDGATESAEVAVFPTHRPAQSFGPRLRQYVKTVGGGANEVYLVFMAIGLVRWRRLLLRSENLPVWLFAVATLAAVWVQLWAARVSSGRYVLEPLVLMLPWCALGLLAVCEGAGAWLARRTAGRWTARHVAPALGVVLAMVGVADAVSSKFKNAEQRIALGKWVQRQIGANSRVLGTADLGRVAAWYAQSECTALPPRCDERTLLRLVRKHQPDMIVMSNDRVDAEALSAAVFKAHPSMFKRLECDGASKPFKKVWILKRTSPAERQAKQAPVAAEGREDGRK